MENKNKINIPCKECICLPTCISIYTNELHENKKFYKVYKNNGIYSLSIIPLYNNCELLDAYIFNKDGEFNMTNGEKKFNIAVSWWKDNYGK